MVYVKPVMEVFDSKALSEIELNATSTCGVGSCKSGVCSNGVCKTGICGTTTY